MRKPKGPKMIKVRHDRDFELKHEGLRWTMDLAEWREEAGTKGELRAYQIRGNICTPLLKEALELEAAARGLMWRMA